MAGRGAARGGSDGTGRRARVPTRDHDDSPLRAGGRRIPTTRSSGRCAPPSSRVRAARPSSSSATSRCRRAGRSSRPTSSSSKYFRGPLGTPAARAQRPPADRPRRRHDRRSGATSRATSRRPTDRQAFADELTHLLLHQKVSFNSPVWFNMGVEPKPQCSACFILSVDDTMDSILDWYRKEGVIFKGGSGSGVNLSRMRSSKERLGGRRHGLGPGVVHARGRRLGRRDQVGRARRGARRRWSC